MGVTPDLDVHGDDHRRLFATANGGSIVVFMDYGYDKIGEMFGPQHHRQDPTPRKSRWLPAIVPAPLWWMCRLLIHWFWDC